MLDNLKNRTIYANKYHTSSEAMIITCFFNPQNSPYRLKAFNQFYESIKHLNHLVAECIIGDSAPQLESNPNIIRIPTDSLLWHKEALLNKLVTLLNKKYKYIFWLDTDVIFTNLNWMVDGVKELQVANIIQPFEYCVHLEKDESEPPFDMSFYEGTLYPNKKNSRVWKSFCSNYADNDVWRDDNYNNHGHVGFAWGARREVLESTPLYDHALIGGADHIIAHAASGQVPCTCITNSFTDNIKEVNRWSQEFSNAVAGKISYVKGNLYHIWHGDIDKRQYLKRVQEYTPISKNIKQRDPNGLYVATKNDQQYMQNYFKQREISHDDGFLTSMALGYMTDSTLIGTLGGGNFAGAMVGEMLHGGSGGGGAMGSWGSPNPLQDLVHERHETDDTNTSTPSITLTSTFS